MSGFDKEAQRTRAAELSATLAAQGQAKPVLPMPAIKSGPKDLEGKIIEVGDKVARAVIRGNSYPRIEICNVTKVEGNKVYLDDSPRALIFSTRVLIVK